MTRLLVLVCVAACSAGGGYKRYDSPPQSAVSRTTSAYRTEGEVVLTAGTASSSARSFGGLLSQATGPSGPPTATVMQSAEAPQPEKLVIEAWIEMQTEEVAATAAAVRSQVQANGGRVISENVIGPPGKASSAAMEIRVPPASATAFLDWLGKQGVVESRRVLASDVSKQLFEQELALQNLGLTMARLQKLAETDIPMKDLLDLEREMTRVRGEIERIKGEQRFLMDRVQFATVTLTLKREGGPVEFAPRARIRPGARVAALTLLDREGRDRNRYGFGLVVHVKRYLTFDLDAFPKHDNESRAIIATIGTAMYSSFLGNGRRQFLNPYVGLRVGYGYLSGDSATAVAGEVGIELFKHEYLLVELAARGVAFLRSENSDVALHSFLGIAVPF